jgi:hypothetical protein
MSLIVAGRFTTFPAAEDAAQTLFDHGFLGEDVTLFFVNPRGQHARHPLDEHAPPVAPTISAAPPPTLHRHHHAMTMGAVAGAVLGVAVFTVFSASMPIVVIAAGVGAYLGSLVGKMAVPAHVQPHEHHSVVHHEMRNSGVLVAVHVSPENQMEAARLLREAGGADIERATGHWQRGRWADFDPRQTPVPLAELNQQQA